MAVTGSEYDMGYADGLGDGVSQAKALHEEARAAVSDFENMLKKQLGQNGVPVAPNADQKFTLNLIRLWNILTSIPLTMYQGYVASKIWGWFVIPNFHGAPHLTTIDCMGLMLLPSIVLTYTMTYLMTMHDEKKLTPWRKIEIAGGRAIGHPLAVSIIFLVAFVYHLFM